MDSGLVLILGAIFSLVVLDVAALRWGADSRHLAGHNWW